jgi:lipoprotein-releasing system ATP-binding protein
MTSPILQVDNVFKKYPTGKNEALEVLRGLSLTVREGEVVAITGASGAGKSTLLHILGGLDRPTSGSVLIDGQDMFSRSDNELAGFRNKNMGFVFQFHHLLPEFTAAENVAIPALIGGEAMEAATKRAMDLLRRVHVAERAGAKPSELSGGEQQRVAVARALINHPKLVFADEPSGNLDEENAALLHDLLWTLAREEKRTFVIVTHDPSIAASADAVHRLHEGVLTRER